MIYVLYYQPIYCKIMTREDFNQLQIGDKVAHPFGGVGKVVRKDSETYDIKDRGFDCGDGQSVVTFAWNEGMVLKKGNK